MAEILKVRDRGYDYISFYWQPSSDNMDCLGQRNILNWFFSLI